MNSNFKTYPSGNSLNIEKEKSHTPYIIKYQKS